jgi:hypothetical protein
MTRPKMPPFAELKAACQPLADQTEAEVKRAIVSHEQNQLPCAVSPPEAHRIGPEKAPTQNGEVLSPSKERGVR